MRLRHTAEYTATIGLVVVGVVALFALAVLTTPLQPTEYSFGARYLILLTGLYSFLLYPLLTFLGERRFRQTTTGGAPHAPVARHQPDRALALAPGETLRMPSSPLRAQARWQGTLLIAFVALALEGFVFYQAPNVGLQLESWSYGLLIAWGMLVVSPLAASSIPPVTIAQWVYVVTPLFIGAMFLLDNILLRYVHFRELLIADDRGLTWQAPLRRTRFMAWGDMQRFVFRFNYPSYGVLGPAATISFDAPLPLGLATATLSTDDTVASPSQRPNQAKIANDAYQVAAERLVATIVARSSRSLLLAPALRGYDYTAEDVTTAPLAGASTLRQMLPTLADGVSTDDRLVVQTRLPWRAFFRLSIRWAWVFPVAFLILLFVMSPTTLLPPAILVPSGYIYIIASCLGFWLMGVLLIPLMQMQRYRNARPTVEANAKELALRGYNNKLVAHVAWEDIRAWAVASLTPNSNGATEGRDPASFGPGRQCIIVTDEDKLLAWDEPADSQLDYPPGATPEVRRAAYREYAASLHALIAARTGLPLRELPPP